MNETAAYASLFPRLAEAGLSAWIEPLRAALPGAFDEARNGHLPKWRAALAALPEVAPSSIDLQADAVRIGYPQDLDTAQRCTLPDALGAFHPWRKGPFRFFSTYIDAEWRSDLKWNRLKDAIDPLAGRRVLDIGCGNGYYAWRMASQGAQLVLGIDPFLLYAFQYLAARKYLTEPPCYVLPLGLEALPPALPVFDSVFSMGVLYHRPDPVEHLRELQSFLRPGGQLVIETLVVNGPSDYALRPQGRYAKMKNIGAIPSPNALLAWLQESGYTNLRLIDLSPTTSAEQRRTPWMRFESLADYLDPADPAKTIEGHPAPQRALVVAHKP